MSLSPARTPVAEPRASARFPLRHPQPLEQYCANTVEPTNRRWGFWSVLVFVVGLQESQKD